MFQDRLQSLLVPALQGAFQQLFGHAIEAKAIGFQQTRPEFEGDVTIKAAVDNGDGTFDAPTLDVTVNPVALMVETFASRTKCSE